MRARVVLTEEEDTPSPLARGGVAAQVALKEVDKLAGERVRRPWHAPIWGKMGPWSGEQLPRPAEILRHPQASGPIAVPPPGDDEYRHFDARIQRTKRPVSPVRPVMLVIEPAQHPGRRFLDSAPPGQLGSGPSRGGWKGVHRYHPDRVVRQL